MKITLVPYLIFFCLLAGTRGKVQAQKARMQDDHRGFFSLQNFSHEELEGHHQNWSISQDKNGFIYAANGAGILEYDGVSWRLISSPGLHAVRAVVADQENVKWVGADRDLGYLAPDSLGLLRFKSLKDKIPPSHPLTGNVWQVFTEKERVLFVTETVIYSWSNNQFIAIPRSGEIQRGNQVNGNLYFRISGKGIYKLSNDNLQLINGGEQFQHIRVDVALPYRNSWVLLASREAGIFVYNGITISKFENQVDDYLDENNLYAGVLLSDSSYAFATLRGGIIIMDKYGSRVREITTREGILNNQVYGMALDHRNALWLALQTGISQIEPSLPYTFYDKKSGLEGTVTIMKRHKGTLYVGTYDGLFAQQPGSEMPATFRRIEGIQNGCFSLLPLGDDLLVGSGNGLYLISRGKVTLLKKLTACRTLLQWSKDTSRIFAGHRGGLSSFYFKDNRWRHEKDFGQIKWEIRSIHETDSGSLWIGTTLHNIINIDFGNDAIHPLNLDVIHMQHFDEQHGLPKEINTLFLMCGQLFVNTYGVNRSLLRFDPGSRKFFSENEFGKKFGLDSLTVYPIDHQNDGEYIFLASMPKSGRTYRFSAARNATSEKYTVKRVYDERFRSTTENQVYWDNKDLIWFGGERVTRYDQSVPIDVKPRFKTYIRKVTLRQDSTIFGGQTAAFIKPAMEYSSNSLRFEFAAPDFMGRETNKYQFRLIGFDTQWSEWTKETRKDYTNLPEGDYQFLVRAQNIYGEMYPADAFNFEVLAPWYRTWYAYVVYVSLFVAFLLVLLQLRARKLNLEKKALELVVADRTKEIQSQANQLKIQAQKLQELDQKKSRFFANVSHEFRTPLTLISGCLEDLAKNAIENDQMKISIMQKNTFRLRQLIEQLLDLSRLESGKLMLHVTQVKPANFLNAITSAFSSWANQKNISFTVKLNGQSVPAYVDEDVLEKIFNNLLSNAMKFTARNGNVSLLADWSADELTVFVKDNGPGIPFSKVGQIFERFYQIDDSNTRSQEGSGIGLALVKELITLHRGRISVESVPEVGSTFKVVIPINQRFYSPAEIASVRKESSKFVGELNSITPTETFFDADETSDHALVLVVEDNVDLGRYIGDHLPDCRIILAFNGVDGFDKAVHHVPDLIISDVMMPELDGVGLCQKIKEDEKTSHIPIILLTAKADMESRLEGLETGADDYLTKPFDARELQTRVNNLIRQRKKLQERFSRTVVLKPKDIAITSSDERFLERVMTIVEDHLGDSEFLVEDFQKEMGMSRMQLHRKLKALTGHSTNDFIRIQRLIRASQMLLNTDNNITEVCYQTGFTSLSYFAKCFKKQFGTTPKEYASSHSQTP